MTLTCNNKFQKIDKENIEKEEIWSENFNFFFFFWWSMKTEILERSPNEQLLIELNEL